MMDELDNLKTAWKTFSELSSKKEYSTQELKRMVRQRSNHELAKIRRKLLMEWSVAIFLSLLLVLFIQIINPADTRFALIFILLILGVSLIPYIQVFRMKFSQQAQLKDYLSEFLLRFNKLIRQYIQMSTVLVPLAGLGGFLLGWHSAVGHGEWSTIITWKAMLVILLICVGISMGGRWVQRSYFNWLYGKNLKRLQQCLDDLEEVEEGK